MMCTYLYCDMVYYVRYLDMDHTTVHRGLTQDDRNAFVFRQTFMLDGFCAGLVYIMYLYHQPRGSPQFRC